MMDDIDRTFDWWNNTLNGVRGPIDADNPMAGFYRWVWKQKKTMGVVAYWYDSNDGSLRCQVDGRDIDDMRARERFPHDSRRPIKREVFDEFRKSGKWLDIDEAAQADSDVAEAAPEVTAAKTLAIVKKSAEKYTKIDSDEDMAKAQSLRSKAQEVAGAADKLRVAEKEPFLESGRTVDAKWQPLIKDAKAIADSLRKAMEAFNNWKLEQADNARKADETAAQRGQASPSPAPVVSNAPPPSTQISGGGGRAASVSIKKIVTSIDIDRAFAQFRGSAELYDVLLKLAQSSIAAGIPVDGATVEERSAIR